MSVNTLRCAHAKSHLALRKKNRPLWPVMMDDSAPAHEVYSGQTNRHTHINTGTLTEEDKEEEKEEECERIKLED